MASGRRESQSILRRYINGFRSMGFSGIGYFVKRVLLGPRPAQGFEPFCSVFRGMNGLEIGGPSRVFASDGPFPIYPLVTSCDNVTFSTRTIWAEDGTTYADRRIGVSTPGHSMVAEATALDGLPSSSYDFVLASNILEHTANPMLALHEWTRVLKPNGLMLVIVPDPSRTFDHRRPLTTLEHVIRDYRNDVGEDDRTHFPEVLALHDLWRDPGGGSRKEFIVRTHQNLTVRAVHHHLFSPELLLALTRAMNTHPLWVSRVPPVHIACLSTNRTIPH